MEPAAGGSSRSSGGGGELRRGGLGRFRSAPATWLEALLDEEEEDPLKPNQCLTQLLSSGDPVAAGLSLSQSQNHNQLDEVGFQRQNSSPADLFDGYYSNYAIPPSFDYLSPNIDASPNRTRDHNTQFPSQTVRFHSHTKAEQSGQVPGDVSNLVDMDMEKILEDSVPCRVRAKRGYATHPRSIAERVRRTRISDRIRKLQVLVPNMDKQTNTADMLEEAVEYVKFLQRQIEELKEHQRRCKCSAKD